MNNKRKLGLAIFLLIALTGLPELGKVFRTLSAGHKSQVQPPVISVGYCDLVKNQTKYVGQIVRVRAVLVGWLDGESLYDSKCKKEGIAYTFDCKNEEECSAMRKTLRKDTDYNGDEGRVEAVLIGNLVLPSKDPASEAPMRPMLIERTRFMIKRIEQTKRISRKVPWLSER